MTVDIEKRHRAAIDVALEDLGAAAMPTKSEVFTACGSHAADLREAIAFYLGRATKAAELDSAKSAVLSGTRAALTTWHKRAETAEAALVAERSARVRLEEALKPFADYGAKWIGPDSEQILKSMLVGRPLTVADLRRAAAALSSPVPSIQGGIEEDISSRNTGQNQCGEQPDQSVGATAALAPEAVAWRVKDFADGYILFDNEAAAQKTSFGMGGAFVEPLYGSAAPWPRTLYQAQMMELAGFRFIKDHAPHLLTEWGLERPVGAERVHSQAGDDRAAAQHADDCQSHIVDVRGNPDPCTCGAEEAEQRTNHDCLAKRRPGEPMFIFLGRDPDAHNLVRLWAARRLAAGGDPEHCQMGLDTAARMEAYAADPANRPASAPPAEAYPPIAPIQAVEESAPYLRPEVIAFACLMEEQLRVNDHKPGWKQDWASELFPRVLEEADELRAAIEFHGKQTDWGEMALHMPTAIAGVGREAADVANFAMMIADVCGALPPTATAPEAEHDCPHDRVHEGATGDGTPVTMCSQCGRAIEIGRAPEAEGEGA